MSLVPPLPEDRDRQFEWFRTIVQILRARGGSVVSDALRDDLQRFTATNLPGHAFPAELDREALAAEVLRLKGNDSSWNKALQSELVAAYEKAKSGDHCAGARTLDEFAISCPWALYSEVARTEAERIRALGERE